MGYLTTEKVDLGAITGLKASLPGRARMAEHAVAIQAAKDTETYVPAMTKSLANRTQVKQNLIIYPGPYARYLYNGKVMVNAATGKGPANIPDVGYRFPKGAKLKPTNRDLDIKKSVHKNAQSHWFEASKGENLEKWKGIAKRAVVKFGE